MFRVIWAIVAVAALGAGVTGASLKVVKVEIKKQNDEFLLPCDVNLNPTPSKFRWFYGDRVISEEDENFTKYYQFVNSSLKLRPLELSYAGHYMCEACNDVTCQFYTVYLNVHLTIDDGLLTNKTEPEGSAVSFVCSSKYEEGSELLWYIFYKAHYTEMNMYSDSSDAKKVDSSKLNPRGNVLTLKEISVSDDGWYTCVIWMKGSDQKYRLGAYRSVYLKVENKAIKLSPSTILIIVSVGFIVVCVVIALSLYRQTKLQKRYLERLVKVVTVTRNGDSDEFQIPIVHVNKPEVVKIERDAFEMSPRQEFEFPIDLEWEIRRDRIKLGGMIGEGHFGKVYKADASGFEEGGKTVPVAVKMLKENHSDEDVKDLVCEMEIMKMVGNHQNIISLLGCCSRNGNLYVITEFAEHGNLRYFLKEHRAFIDHDQHEHNFIDIHQLISFAIQIATGMVYLSSIKCIHRDLAARNILVSKGFAMKISDFGLARNVHIKEYYRTKGKGPLPLFWLAPESLETFFFGIKSDVWSFGVLLWEIMSFGEDPYNFPASWQSMLLYLKEGNRLEQPARCPNDVYLIMENCWQFNAEDRPSFNEIIPDLRRCYNIEPYIFREQNATYESNLVTESVLETVYIDPSAIK